MLSQSFIAAIAHTAAGDIRSKLQGFAGYQPLLRRQAPATHPPAAGDTPGLRGHALGDLRILTRGDFPGARPVARRLPTRAGARHPQPCTCPGGRRAPSPPSSPPSPPRHRRPRLPPAGRAGRGPPAGPQPPRPQPLPAVSPHLSGRGPGGHLVSLGAARGSSDPKLRAAGPPARSSRHRPHKHLPGTSGAGAGAAGKARPTGRGFKWDKSPGSVRPARASPRGTPGRRLGLRRPRPARRSVAPGPPAVPSALGRLFRSLLPHLTSPERAAAKRRAVGGQSRRGQLKQPRKTCRTGPLSMPGRRGRGLGGGRGQTGSDPRAEGKALLSK